MAAGRAVSECRQTAPDARRPRIDLLAPPFAGHLHPILAIGRAVQDLAEVRVLSTESAQARIRAAGLRGEVILPAIDEALRAITDPALPVGSNPRRLLAQFDASLGVLEAFAVALRSRYADQRPDLIIADFTLPVVGPIAQLHGIPWWTSHPSPCVIEAPGGPPAYLGGWLPGVGWLGKLRDRGAALVVRGFKHSIGRWYARRLAALGIDALYRSDGSETAYSPQCILALGLRELEFERAWPASVEFIGPMLWSPPQQGPAAPDPDPAQPRILATLGTHLGFAKTALATRLTEIAALHRDWQLHFSAGRLEPDNATLDGDPGPGRLRQHAWIDYPSWIPRMQAVIHHGGAGVMWECLRAGVPQIVLPLDYDQFDHAARLQAAGLGLRLRHPAQINAALRQVIEGTHALQADRHVEALRPGLAEDRLRARLIGLLRPRIFARGLP